MARRTSWAVGVCMVLAAFGGGSAAQLLVGGGAVSAQEKAADELRVQRLVVVDEAGTERATLAARGDGVGLILMDSEGRPRAGLGHTALIDADAEPYWVLTFLDAEGVGRVGVGTRDDGEACGGHVTDDSGISRIGFGVTGVGVTFTDGSGQERLGIGIGPGGGGDFVAKDQFGNDLWRALGDTEALDLP